MALGASISDRFGHSIATRFDVVSGNTGVATPSLKQLFLSATSVLEGTATDTVVGAVQNLTSGSTWALTGTAGNRFAKSGNNVVVGATALDYDDGATWDIEITETNVAFTPSTRITTIAITIPAPAMPDVTGLNIDEHSLFDTVIGTINVTNSLGTWTFSSVDDGEFNLAKVDGIAATQAEIRVLTVPQRENYGAGPYVDAIRIAADRGSQRLERTYSITINDVAEVAVTDIASLVATAI